MYNHEMMENMLQTHFQLEWKFSDSRPFVVDVATTNKI